MRASPACAQHPSDVPCPLPRWIGTGASVGCFPIPCEPSPYCRRVGIHSALSRPARASRALRPAGSLSRPRRPLSQGSGPPVARTNRLPATSPTDNCLGGTCLHWCSAPFRAHCNSEAYCTAFAREAVQYGCRLLHPTPARRPEAAKGKTRSRGQRRFADECTHVCFPSQS
jgi:hypothetical protein